MALIPKKINASYQKSEKDFTRDRQLPFPKLIVFVLSLTASGKCEGVDIKSGKFFKNAKRSDLWPNAEAVHRSTITKARQKLDWRIFKDIFRDSVDLAYDLWPKDASTYEWHGMSVFAVDGSTCILPASKEIREEFDKDSGLENIGRGHYPECLVSTVYDVFRRIPIARTIVGKDDACERTQAKAMIKHIPSGSIILFDRGYPSYMFIFSLIENHKGYFILRCPAKNSFKAIDEFIKSSKDEDIIYINPPDKLTKKEREQLNPIKLRIVKLTSPDGEVSVLLTNLYDEQTFTANEIIELYFRRWEVENHYRDEKVYLEIEKFHARLPNGVRQELFAILIMTVISKLLMALTKEGKIESQFKGAIMGLASEAAILAPEYPEKSVEIFREVLKEISRIKYYRPKTPRPSQPRVTKRPNNKWNKDKVKKAKETKSKKIRDP
ncbi:MAG: IS4 family transposase [Lentisphaerae bacterium]|nr:IS4 family transposase [Lentisphaerota bacterium]